MLAFFNTLLIFHCSYRSIYSRELYLISKLQYSKYIYLLQTVEIIHSKRHGKASDHTLATLFLHFSQISFSLVLDRYPHSGESIFVGHSPIWMEDKCVKNLKLPFCAYLHWGGESCAWCYGEGVATCYWLKAHTFKRVLVLGVPGFKFWYFVILSCGSIEWPLQMFSGLELLAAGGKYHNKNLHGESASNNQ